METSSPRRTSALARLLLATTTMLAIVVGGLLSSAPATAAVIDNGITSVTANKTAYDYTERGWEIDAFSCARRSNVQSPWMGCHRGDKARPKSCGATRKSRGM